MSFTRKLFMNRHSVYALALGVAAFGIYAYLRLPMQLFPDTAPPLVTVVTPYPGAGADEVVRDLTRPLEEELASVEGVVDVSSRSQDNLSVISLEFTYDRSADLAAVDVQNAIARIRGSLPDAIQEPRVLKMSVNDRPIVSVGVSGEDSAAVRRLVEDRIAPRFHRLEGVAGVDVFGGSVSAVNVEVDREKMVATGLSIQHIVATLKERNISAPGGSIKGGRRSVNVRVEGRSMSIKDIETIPIPTQTGKRILLRDVAVVNLGSLDDESAFSIRGEQSIAVQIFKTDDANTIEVVERVQKEIEELRSDYPGLEFKMGEESASFTKTVVDNLLTNVWQALLLASIVVFLFLGALSSSIVVVVSMPLSFALTFAMMKLFGVEFNMVTLSAVILSVGMVVDGAVVMVENITRHRADSLSDPEGAVAEGADEIRFSVIAGVATTLIVLVPLLFLEGFIGKTFGPLALTLLFAFSGSALTAVVIIPVLANTLGTFSRLDKATAWLTRPFDWVVEWVRKGYVRLLGFALKWRSITLLLAVVLLLGGVVGLRSAGMDVLPKMDGGAFVVSLETVPGSSLEETVSAIRSVEKVLDSQPEVVLYQSQAGYEAGMRSMSASGVQGPTQGMVSVTLVPRTARKRSIWDIQDSVRRGVAQIPGVHYFNVRETGNTAKATTGAPIVIRITGDDPLVLDRMGSIVAEVAGKVDSVVEPTRSWRLDNPLLLVEVDELLAAEMGLSSARVAQFMLQGSRGINAGDFHGVEGKPSPVFVRYGEDFRRTPRNLLQFPFQTAGDGRVVPLSVVASAHEETGQGMIARNNLALSLEISALIEGRPLSKVVSELGPKIQSMDVPHGYEIELVGENKDMVEARSEIGAAMIIALAAVYLLLVAQFRSFVHPFTVLMTVPLSLSGVAAGLWIASKPVSMPVMVGLVLLVGIVVNNAIILLDFIRQRRDAGMNRREAVEASVSKRFRPIIMTAVSTIVGMFPLAAEWALGAERFSPLAIAVIGGLTTATFLTLIVIPVLYDVLDDASGIFKKSIHENSG